MRAYGLASLFLILLVTACASDPPPAPAAPPASAPEPSVMEAPEPAEAPAATAPESVHEVRPPVAPDPAATKPKKSSDGLSFTTPEGWIEEKPTSRMRRAQFRLPGEDGADASLVMFVFGGTGGGVDANVERWIGQFTQPDGSATADVTKRSEREVDGMKVHLVDIPGNYTAETSPGSGKRVNKATHRMLGAIVLTGSQSYFLKMIGPAATVARWHDAFQQYVDSARN